MGRSLGGIARQHQLQTQSGLGGAASHKKGAGLPEGGSGVVRLQFQHPGITREGIFGFPFREAGLRIEEKQRDVVRRKGESGL